jgi:uncharacterized membrane protein YiaA
MTKSEKGFYAAVFAMTLFAAVAVQKNVRTPCGSGHRVGPATSARSGA